MKKIFSVLSVLIVLSVFYEIGYSADYNYPNVTVRDTDGDQLKLDGSGRVSVLLDTVTISGITASSTTAQITVYQGQNFTIIDKSPAALATYAISADSTTATLGRNTNTSRKKIEFHNNGAQTVYISTWAATATTNLYPLLKQTVFSDNSGYTGAYYVMTIAEQSAQNVRIIEWSY